MRRCFELAKLGNGFVAPNPMVGAVLVYEDKIIGEGYHQRYGEAHAEVNCINSVALENKLLIPFSTLYVNLEPCAHHGKTPPCTALILEQKIKKVIIANEDNFSLVNGKGIEKLRKNGIEVICNILAEEGKALNKKFFYFHQHKLPYITLKFAQTADKYLGIQQQEIKITNALSQRYVHQLRAENQAILVGKNTILADNPRLDVRLVNGNNPIRIVLGNEENIPKDFNIFNSEIETFFLFENEHKKMEIEKIVQQIASKNIISVLVEGGADVLQQFIDANYWNEAHILTNSRNLESISQEKNEHKYIKAPTITGIPTSTLNLKDDFIQVLKNPNALSLT